MKDAGSIRRVDELGRVVIPVAVRRALEISGGDEVKVFVEGSSVVLTPCRDRCVFCGADRDMSRFRGRYVCARCLRELPRSR